MRHVSPWASRRPKPTPPGQRDSGIKSWCRKDLCCPRCAVEVSRPDLSNDVKQSGARSPDGASARLFARSSAVTRVFDALCAQSGAGVPAAKRPRSCVFDRWVCSAKMQTLVSRCQITMSNSQRFAARALEFSGAGRRPFPFSFSLADEGNGAPGGAGRFARAPWRAMTRPAARRCDGARPPVT